MSITTQFLSSLLAQRGLTDREQLHQRIDQGMAEVPESEMVKNAEYLHNILLPLLTKKKGAEHADTRYFESVRDSLLWAIHTLGKYHVLVEKYHNAKNLLEFLTERNRLLEQRLAQYEAMEELTTAATMETYRNARIRQGIEMLEKIKQAQQTTAQPQ